MLMRIMSVLSLAVALVLGGCARDVRTEVTRFHAGHLPAGESFAVLPAESLKAGPEFDSYAEMVVEEMTGHGFKRAASDEAAMHVLVDYAVSEGRTKIESRPGYAYPHYSYHVGYYHHPFHYGFYSPFYHDGYLGPDIRSETVYTRKLSMKIRNTRTDEIVFEGRAISEGPTQEISKVMPYLVESMFRNFPGESGTTKLVKIESRDGSRY